MLSRGPSPSRTRTGGPNLPSGRGTVKACIRPLPGVPSGERFNHVQAPKESGDGLPDRLKPPGLRLRTMGSRNLPGSHLPGIGEPAQLEGLFLPSLYATHPSDPELGRAYLLSKGRTVG